jgi:hypothetical protein
MNLALALILLAAQDPVSELQQKLRAVFDKVKPAYVFFGTGRASASPPTAGR